jgi:methylmalonyl-CoA epimerase
MLPTTGRTRLRRGPGRVSEYLGGGLRGLVVRLRGRAAAAAAAATGDEHGRENDGEGEGAYRGRESFKYDRQVVTPNSVHHVGLAVDDLDGALDTYERLFGARLEHRSRVEEQGVEAASIRVGESRFELLGALSEDTPVGRFLAHRGPGMHHVAYEVDDIRAALAHLSDAGAELIDETPRRGMFGLEVAFVHPDSVHGVLSEVVAVG